jgi:UDPglucose 6-dehydrogenase
MRVGFIGTRHVGLVTAATLASLSHEAGASAVVLATDWAEFRDLDFARLRSAVAAPVFVDARNAIDGRAVPGSGFAYVPMGKQPLRPEA